MADSNLDILHSLQRLPTVQYLHVVATSVLIYDYVLTLETEIHYVWGAPWNLGKVLFIVTRYPAFIDSSLTLYHEVGKSLSIEKCAFLYRITGILIIIGIVIAEIILLVRVWALWGRTRNMLIFLVSVAVACVIAAIVGFIKFHSTQTFIAVDSLSPNLRGCFPRGSNIVWVDFVILMAFETLVAVMTLIKGVEHFRKGSSSFINTFLRDGIMYFVFLLAISVINVVILISADPDYTNILTSLQRALHAILSARMLLHLRQFNVSSHQRGLPTIQESTRPDAELSMLQFAARTNRSRSDPAWASGVGGSSTTTSITDTTTARSWFGNAYDDDYEDGR